MSTLLFLLFCVVGLAVFFHFKIFSSKFKAAMNALLAKYTFETLDTEVQKSVIEKTESILLRDGGFSEAAVEERMDGFTEKERYGFYALAMSELNISPALSKYNWYHVSNPFVALINADHQMRMARRHLIKSEDIDIEM